ncbi:hypothetical protein OG777_25845 [Micromonospora peucetia]|uniref:Uncharacterized protein n=1 Tax=Micromonospora peucetia TaxID=47871 RepID=A0ABZ1EC28_9ACTN|nr:hypothetical protein [Micromonospora peucetia]MCX4390320.1 hypothetical protein [Micromonospora peucetia]WSA32376.1 hypothetical protein OIE14_30480 [Micromonospora peucetia]
MSRTKPGTVIRVPSSRRASSVENGHELYVPLDAPAQVKPLAVP